MKCPQHTLSSMISLLEESEKLLQESRRLLQTNDGGDLRLRMATLEGRIRGLFSFLLSQIEPPEDDIIPLLNALTSIKNEPETEK